MSQFEFFMIIASVLVAIGLTEVVGWWGQLLRSDKPIEVSRIHLGWSVVFVCNVVLYWSGFWAYNDVELTSFGQIWMLLLPTLFLILVAFALTPGTTNEEAERGGYFERKRSKIFGCWAAFCFLAVLADVAIVDSPTWEGAIPGLVVVSVFAICATVRNSVANYAAMVLFLLLFVVVPVSLGFREGMDFWAN
ncbi:MAG: hypothetical protein ACU84Q_20480 [Gammaproteobacteria bacterium]